MILIHIVQLYSYWAAYQLQACPLSNNQADASLHACNTIGDSKAEAEPYLSEYLVQSTFL